MTQSKHRKIRNYDHNKTVSILHQEPIGILSLQQRKGESIESIPTSPFLKPMRRTIETADIPTSFTTRTAETKFPTPFVSPIAGYNTVQQITRSFKKRSTWDLGDNWFPSVDQTSPLKLATFIAWWDYLSQTGPELQANSMIERMKPSMYPQNSDEMSFC